jgi:hypothetical protein
MWPTPYYAGGLPETLAAGRFLHGSKHLLTVEHADRLSEMTPPLQINGQYVAIESAGIVLVRSDPRDVVAAIKLSCATYRKMIQNLVWATAYNLVAIPVAGGVLVRWGLDLPMSVGAVSMSLSTIIVAANAQLLRRLSLQRAAP